MGGPGSGRRKVSSPTVKVATKQPRDSNGKFKKVINKVGITEPMSRHGKQARTSKKAQKKIYDMIVFDYSGSMSSISRTTMKGINDYLTNLKETSGRTGIKTYCSMIRFDNRIEVMFLNKDSNEIVLLDSYPVRGTTALYDAIVEAINKTELNIGIVNLLNKDYDATITIFTDGHENASISTLAKVSGLINKVQVEYGWTIAFIGCGPLEQVRATTAAMGIFASNTASYDGTNEGMAAMASSLSVSRSAKSLSYAAGKQSNIGFFSEE